MKNNADALKEHFALKDRVLALENELKLQKKLTSKYKTLYRSSIGEHELPTDKARKLIRRDKLSPDGSVCAMCRRIASEVGLNEHTVRALWYAKS